MPKGEQAEEITGKGKAANGAHKENHVSCRTLQALSVVGHVCEYVSATANIWLRIMYGKDVREWESVSAREMPIKDEQQQASACII